jgi:cell division protease FtsH
MADPEDFEKRAAPAAGPRRPRWAYLLLVILALIVLLWYVQVDVNEPRRFTYPEFLQEIDRGNIATITVSPQGEIAGELAEGGPTRRYRTEIPEPMLADSKAITEVKDRFLAKNGDPKNFMYAPPPKWVTYLVPFLPWALLLGLAWFFFFRQMRATTGPGGILAFGRSRARLAGKERRKVTFADVAGVEEAKEEVGELIEFLKDPAKFQRLGARIPRGVLLVGAPGTGKTLLAKAIAGEADVPFFSICGSDFVEMFVGVGASRVRDLFRQAKESAPCIIFLDEIDAVGRRRGTGLGGGHDEREQTLNAILVEMDGFDTDDNVIVIASTNRPDVLDPALLRPGRFDREITLDLPDVRAREEILKVHARKVKMRKGVDLTTLARTTPTFSGADLEAVVNEAALLATMKHKEFVEEEDLEEARDKVRWGRQKRSRVMDQEDRRITAYHEAGHALVSFLLPDTEPVHKVTIVPRGMALGSTMMLPDKDRYHMQKRWVLSRITVFFGGRAAEEAFCGDVDAGARSDIKEATELARLMVCEWGMSEALGPVNYSETEEHLFLGREIARTRNHSEKTAQAIDAEVHRIIDECLRKARALIGEHRDACDRIAQALLRYEVLTGAEVDALIHGRDIEAIRREARPQAV